MPENILRENGRADLNAVNVVCISGLDTYHEVKKIASFPYAKPDDLPRFRRNIKEGRKV